MNDTIWLYQRWEGWNFEPLGHVDTFHPKAEFRKVRWCTTHDSKFWQRVEAKARGPNDDGMRCERVLVTFEDLPPCVISDRLVEVV